MLIRSLIIIIFLLYSCATYSNPKKLAPEVLGLSLGKSTADDMKKMYRLLNEWPSRNGTGYVLDVSSILTDSVSTGKLDSVWIWCDANGIVQQITLSKHSSWTVLYDAITYLSDKYNTVYCPSSVELSSKEDVSILFEYGDFYIIVHSKWSYLVIPITYINKEHIEKTFIEKTFPETVY